MKTYKVTYEVQFEDGLKPHTVYARDCEDEADAESKVKFYWIVNKNLPIGRCLKVELV